VQSHKELSASRVKAIVGSMSTALMSQELPQKSTALRHFLDEEFKKV
jgi:hypothetical protein